MTNSATTKVSFISVLFVLAATSLFVASVSGPESFDNRRARVLGELTSAIDSAVDEGNYACCIDPPCTMCYMGNWIWDDGICRCDEMIANGELDKVCPQCTRAIGEGLCESSDK